MGAVFGIVAFLVALAGLLAALGNAGYLAMLGSTAGKRGMSGAAALDYVRRQRTVALVLLAAGVVGLLFTLGGVVPDVIGLLLGGGAAVGGVRALNSTRRRFRTG